MTEVHHAFGLHPHQPPGNLVARPDQPYSAQFTLPPLSIIAFKPERVEAAPAPAEARPAEKTH